MLNVTEFPGCCNAVVLFDFGGTFNSLYGHDKVHPGLEEFLDEAIEEYGHMMLVATTNNEQIAVNELLERKGFSNNGWMHKNQHPTTTFTLWWMPPRYTKELIARYWKDGKRINQ